VAEPTAEQNASSGARPSLAPVLVALSVMVVWGGTPLFTKLAAEQIDPLLVGILRTVFAGVVALPLVALRRDPLPDTRRGLSTLAFSGFAAFIAFPLVFTLGQAQTSAMHGALILATLPVFTSLFGTLLERRRVSAMWIAGCSIALGGEAIVIAIRTGGASSGSSLRGDLIILASSVVCSLGYVAGARLAQGGYPSLPTTLWGVGMAAVVLLPLLGWAVARDGWPQADGTAWGSILVLAVLTSIIGYVAWYWALAAGGISRIAGIQFTQPLFGLALAAFVLGERPGPIVLVAGVAILAGAWMVQRAGTTPRV
jgi:drug/metabolite transporter (DMT)-like permease